MANVVLLKRTAVAGKVPTTAQISLGELVINTNDGKLFLKKSVAGTESIVDLTAFVSSVSVATANGFSGTVATSTTTPTITISVSPSGLLKGVNGVISAAQAGTDYLAPAAIGTTIDPAGTATAMAIALG